MPSNLSLLSSQSRVEVPFVKVTIGNYTFGVYAKSKYSTDSQYKVSNKVQYPNYVRSLQVKKINGKVNTYTLVLVYPITETDDPNFFDKVFSSVSKTRTIVFSYGDLSVPSFVYREEQAIITDIKQDFQIQSSVIQYTVSAVSSAFLATSGAYTFKATRDKPSNIIRELLYGDFGMLELFTGMRNRDLVESYNLIPSGDRVVDLELHENTSPLDYLAYLVNCMRPADTNPNSIQQGSVYTLNIIDSTSSYNRSDENKEFIFDGPYFEIVRNNKNDDPIDTYVIDIGFPSQNIVTQFGIENNENFSILYDYQAKLNQSYYVQRIDNDGNFEQVYSPMISSKNPTFTTQEQDKTWWTKVTQYPIKVNLTLKGLLRPALLMSYVRLNVYFYGKKHNSSGLYILTQQIDNINEQGFKTSLSLTRVGGDNSQQ